jgi:DNA-binding Xre family transcriptional regulator
LGIYTYNKGKVSPFQGLVIMKRKKSKTEDPELSKALARLGKNIKALRELRGMTLQDLAFHSSLALSTVWEIESARVDDLRLSTVAALARALSVSIQELMVTKK